MPSASATSAASAAHRIAELRRRGYLARDESVASVTDRLAQPGSSDHARVLHAQVTGGLAVDVLPARGLDVGAASVAGHPLAWASPVADARALDRAVGEAWIDRFTGGLLATCGLANFGPARDADATGLGVHGDVHHLPARNVRATPSRGLPEVVVEGDVERSTVFGSSVRVERRISNGLDARGRPQLEVADRIVNTSSLPAPVAALYHVNLGAPLVLPGTTVDVDAERSDLREPCPQVPSHAVLPEACEEVTEAVFEHVGVRVDADGLARARVTSPDGLGVEVSWSAATLPRLYQWVLPSRGRWALGVEPASAPLFGPDRTGEHAGAPLLAPGETREHLLRITVVSLPSPSPMS